MHVDVELVCKCVFKYYLILLPNFCYKFLSDEVLDFCLEDLSERTNVSPGHFRLNCSLSACPLAANIAVVQSSQEGVACPRNEITEWMCSEGCLP